MVQWLKALVALPGVLGSIPAPTGWFTTVISYNSSSRKYDALFWLLQVPGMHMVHRHTYIQNTHAHKTTK